MRLVPSLLLAGLLLLVPAVAAAGTGAQLELLDQEAYQTRVEPALALWSHSQTVEPLRTLLRETIRRLEPRLDAELRKVERPKDARAARDLDRLRKMLELVRTWPALRLVLTD